MGLEADFQGALERDSNTLTSDFRFSIGGPGFTAFPAGSTVLDYQTKIDWFGTVRARIGYVWGNGNVLSYVTGGLAYGKVDVEGTSTVSAVLTSLSPVTQAFSHSQVNAGWTVGYGTEGKLLIPGWTLKAEYLYVDLGTLDDNDPPPPTTISVLGGGQTFTHTHFTDGILRAGLNYQFH